MERCYFKDKKQAYIIVMSVIAFTFVIVAIVSAFYTSKAKEIKYQQQKLISYNQKLQQHIDLKKEEYDAIQDKIEDLETLIGQNRSIQKRDIAKILNALSTQTKQLIVDALPQGYPCSSKRITSKFGYRVHPIYKSRRFHHGIDFGGKMGTPIVATADGIVEFADFDKGYGNLVVISHNFGFKTAYGHMQKKLQVVRGDFVKKGDVIGYLGNSGISTGPHLHYEVKYIKNVLDPYHFLTVDLENFEKLLNAQNHIVWESLIHAIMHQYGSARLVKLL
ncbi:MAG: M23 family metallopeptidase [Epsilonproteobacteria bacterium]|nr:M23 family metallopeptidase [Campylobacterota bacterium]